jgi:hypothetical protein
MPDEWFACESLLVESVTDSPETLFSGHLFNAKILFPVFGREKILPVFND